MAKQEKSIDDILNEFEDNDSTGKARPNGKDKPGKKAAPAKKGKGVPTPQPTDAKLAPITAIRTKMHKTNTRGKLTDVDLEDLLPSVAKLGIIEPLSLLDEGDGSFTLVAGKRRLATAKKVGLKDVPYTLTNPDVTNIELVSAVENLCQKDLKPMEEAKAYKVLIDGYKMSQNDLAKFIGKTSAHVSQKLALLGAPKKDQEKLTKGQATESSVRRALTKSTGKGKSRPGPKTKTVNIPVDDLPLDVSLSVKESFDVQFSSSIGVPRQTAILTIKVTLNKIGQKPKTTIAGALKSGVARTIKNLNDRRINAAYKSIVGV